MDPSPHSRLSDFPLNMGSLQDLLASGFLGVPESMNPFAAPRVVPQEQAWKMRYPVTLVPLLEPTPYKEKEDEELSLGYIQAQSTYISCRGAKARDHFSNLDCETVP
jgi:hypothetical protein